MGVGVVVERWKGAQKKTSELPRTAARRGEMASASQERVQAAQRITNTFGVLEVARALEEVKSQVIGTIGLRRAMARAKTCREGR